MIIRPQITKVVQGVKRHAKKIAVGVIALASLGATLTTPQPQVAQSCSVPGAVANCLFGKTPAEKAQIKGQYIASMLTPQARQRFSFSGRDYEIQVISASVIPGGVELLARAWKLDGTQVGFGSDGSVDIERFQFFNPPILVDDPNGSIVRDNIDEKGVVSHRPLREDPKMAIIQSLIHTISVVAKDDKNIVAGKVGHTVSTYFPNAGAASAPTNAVLRSLVSGVGFSTIRTDTTTRSAITSTNDTAGALLESFPAPGQFDELRRSGYGFPTTNITDTITSVTFSLWVNSVSTTLGDTSVDVVGFTPGSDPPMVAADYSNFGTTRYATGLTISTMTTAAYNDWTFNATGIANTNKVTNSYFGITLKWDTDNSYTGSSPGDGSQTKIVNKFADNVGTSSDPKLVVTHSVVVSNSTGTIIDEINR